MAAANGLTFNQSCLDRQLRELHDGYGCSTEYTGEQACSVCAPVHGDLPVGATCREFGDYSDCAADLDCWGNRCINYCEGLAEGALCIGENFHFGGLWAGTILQILTRRSASRKEPLVTTARTLAAKMGCSATSLANAHLNHGKRAVPGHLCRRPGLRRQYLRGWGR